MTQKAFDSPDGQVIYELLQELTKADMVQVPVDSVGKIDPLAVQYNEGKRSIMCQVDALIKKNVNEIKQEKAEVK